MSTVTFGPGDDGVSRGPLETALTSFSLPTKKPTRRNKYLAIPLQQRHGSVFSAFRCRRFFSSFSATIFFSFSPSRRRTTISY